jgi:hypothetical protein
MSWWDPIVNFFGSAADTAGSVAGDVGSAISSGASTAADTLGRLWDSGSQALGGITNGSGGSSAAGLSPMSYDNSVTQNLGPIGSAGGAYNPVGDITPGPASMGVDISSGLDQAGKWAKNNPSLVNAGLNMGTTLLAKHGVPGGTQRAADLQGEGNASEKDIAGQKTAVGQSMISQAPFQANNAYAGAMNTNAANETALQRQMNAQGYHAGDAMYDSRMAEGRNEGSKLANTAWAQGQNNMAGQESTGAGLLTAYTPKTNAYTALGSAQTAENQDSNEQNAGIAAGLQNAYDIYAGGDTAPTIKNASKSKP